jgi:hypothetical protein
MSSNPGIGAPGNGEFRLIPAQVMFSPPVRRMRHTQFAKAVWFTQSLQLGLAVPAWRNPAHTPNHAREFHKIVPAILAQDQKHSSQLSPFAACRAPRDPDLVRVHRSRRKGMAKGRGVLRLGYGDERQRDG